MTNGITGGHNLFGGSRFLGLDTRADVVSCSEQVELIEQIGATEPKPFRFHGWLGKRLITSYGIGYDFDAAKLELADPLPEWLMPVRARAAKFAGLDPVDPTQALLIRYDPGASIGWHRDRPYHEHGFGISLGAPATLRLRRRAAAEFARFSMPLAPHSIYHLSGEARHVWEHSIAAIDETRWSITFRGLSPSDLATLHRTSPAIPVQR